jgi:hypothetical protein
MVLMPLPEVFRQAVKPFGKILKHFGKNIVGGSAESATVSAETDGASAVSTSPVAAMPRGRCR